MLQDAHISEFLNRSIVEDSTIPLGETFHEFRMYKIGEIEKFIHELHILIGREIYYTDEPCAALGIVINKEKGCLIQIASVEHCKFNTLFQFSSTRIMSSLRKILEQCQYANRYIDLKVVRTELKSWFEKFDIPYTLDSSKRRNYPLNINPSLDLSNSPNKKFIFGHFMEPEFLSPIYEAFQCSECLKTLKLELDIKKHVKTHSKTVSSSYVNLYCQRFGKTLISCQIDDRINRFIKREEERKILKFSKVDKASVVEYFLPIDGERYFNCKLLNTRYNTNNPLGELFSEEYSVLRNIWPQKPLIVKRKRLLRFYLKEEDEEELNNEVCNEGKVKRENFGAVGHRGDNAEESEKGEEREGGETGNQQDKEKHKTRDRYHFSLNYKNATKFACYDLTGQIMTICKYFHGYYEGIFQGDEYNTFAKLLNEKLSWKNFVNFIIEIVLEEQPGLMRVITWYLYREYDDNNNEVKVVPFSRREERIRNFISFLRICVSWYSCFIDDESISDRLENSLLSRYSEIGEFVNKIYYPHIHGKTKKKYLFKYNPTFQCFTHSSDWGVHLVGIYSLNLMIEKNKIRITRLIEEVRKTKIEDLKQIEFKTTIDSVYRSVSEYLIQMLLILNPITMELNEYCKLELQSYKLRQDDNMIDLYVKNGSDELRLVLDLDINIFTFWLHPIRTIYHENHQDLKNTRLFFRIEEFEEIVNDMSNEELAKYLYCISGSIVSKKQWRVKLSTTPRLQGESYIKKSVDSFQLRYSKLKDEREERVMKILGERSTQVKRRKIESGQ